MKSVRKGVRICRENKVDIILAVGGGSSIDCSKAIAGAYYYEDDAWNIVIDPRKVIKVLLQNE
jgi:alcohol dehydrogenase YqhD (iron-dependent ADH family)